MKIMFKKQLKEIHRVPYSVFLILFIVSGFVAINALRHNNQTMVQLRSEVYTADQSGGDINTALNNLRKYVYDHMNTDLSSGGNAIKPPIQLKYTYERLLASQDQAAQAANSKIYTDAQNFCQSQNQAFYGTTRVPCVQDYVASHGVKTAPIIPAALYQFDFVSPAWSPDLAGWSLAFTVLMGLGFITSLIIQFLTKRKLKEPL